jgi:hypothetical protein
MILFGIAHAKKSAIVYYGSQISYPIVGVHDYIIVQPDNITTYNHGFKLYKDKIYGYVSIGEAEKARKYYKKLKKSWIIGKNSSWKSKIMDISQKEYRDFLFKEVIEPMRKRGFKNFFFDTLDSYQSVSSNSEFKKRMEDGLVTFIKEFKKQYPDSKIIINRGFEIVDKVCNDIEAMLVESMFYGLSSELKFKKVSQKDRKWLLNQINKVKSYDIPIISVEYIPRSKKKEIKNTLEQLNRLNLIPYISFNKELNGYGFSNRKPIKRELLLIYDDTQFEGSDDDDKVNSTAYLQLSTPIEYMGYIPILKAVSTLKITPEFKDRFAGAIIWLNGRFAMKHSKEFMKIVRELYFNDVKMLILESLNPDYHRNIFKLLGIRISPTSNLSHVGKISCKKGYAHFEIRPFVPNHGYIYRPLNSKDICTIKDKRTKGSLWSIMDWGGFAREGVLLTNINKYDLWIANPFKLIKEALKLKDIPAPDPTTENGKRVLFSHIDGDAIMSRVEWNNDLFDGETIYEEVLKKYEIPMSVSIIEGETAPYGLYKEFSPKLEKIAKKMFALPHVEGATHTFSHPFYWGKITKDGKALNKKYRLKVPNYNNFSIDREIGGSLKYINEHLMPKGKKANLVFWSGDCLPRENALEYVHKNGILNMNGGDTVIMNSSPWLSLIAPFGLRRGEYYQIHTGQQDENVYTEDWTDRFWGFRRAIQTYKLTNSPRRLKPIDIYYHFYSGSKRASLVALQDIFDWATKQDVIPIYTSMYIKKALDFFYASESGDQNHYHISGMKNLKTVRIKKSLSVDFDKSIGVVGEKIYKDSKYIHLAPNIDNIELFLQNKRTDQNFLVSSNGILKKFDKKRDQIKLKIKAFMPLEIEYHLKDGCSLSESPKADKKILKNGVLKLNYEKTREATIRVQCR